MAKKRQAHLPTMEPPSIPEIDDAAERYTEIRDSRMGKLEEETEAQAILMALMKKHKLKVYELPDGRNVELCATEKVKVRKPKDEEE